ncbi:MAG: DUF2695 domain-containing protein [Streptosporangiaceae bacterium]|jgi:hypothetical protein
MPGIITTDNPATSQTRDPAERECLRCYLRRLLSNLGCDGTKTWTTRWTRRRAPRDTGLLRRIENLGGCCCDCEVLLNVWEEQEDADVGPCSGTTHEDPLVPCPAWAPHPEMLIREPQEYEYEDDAYRSYGDEPW